AADWPPNLLFRIAMSDTLIPRRDTVPVPAVLNTRLDEFLAGPDDPETDARAGSGRGRRLFWADGFVSNASESFAPTSRTRLPWRSATPPRLAFWPPQTPA
ncbi:MAG: hypothetical protein ACM30E_02590, partial [Nitrososphaerales archaeon]